MIIKPKRVIKTYVYECPHCSFENWLSESETRIGKIICICDAELLINNESSLDDGKITVSDYPTLPSGYEIVSDNIGTYTKPVISTDEQRAYQVLLQMGYNKNEIKSLYDIAKSKDQYDNSSLSSIVNSILRQVET